MNIKATAVFALALSTIVTLSGCGGTTGAVTAAADTPTPVSAPTASPIPKVTPTTDTSKSVRGNLIMHVGDTGTISAGDVGKVTTKFTVNAITVGACNQQYSEASKNGQIVFVDLTAETTPELAQSSYPKFTLSGYDFKFIADNGTTFNGDLGTVATYSCLPDTQVFPSAGMGPAEKVTAKVVLDLPAAHGTLVMKSGLSGGFEYKF